MPIPDGEFTPIALRDVYVGLNDERKSEQLERFRALDNDAKRSSGALDALKTSDTLMDKRILHLRLHSYILYKLEASAKSQALEKYDRMSELYHYVFQYAPLQIFYWELFAQSKLFERAQAAVGSPHVLRAVERARFPRLLRRPAMMASRTRLRLEEKDEATTSAASL